MEILTKVCHKLIKRKFEEMTIMNNAQPATCIIEINEIDKKWIFLKRKDNFYDFSAATVRQQYLT